jgi:hypothetical protein
MKPKRRRFSRDARFRLNAIQELKDQLRELREQVPVRQPEVDALVGLLSELQDVVLDGDDMDERSACQQLMLVNAFTVSVWHELGMIKTF